jgi:hypothetical protein
VDGGVTTYNNAAFLAYQMATAAPYHINWKTGTDQLLIVSVGTGSAPAARPDLQPGDMWLVDNAKTLPGALMNAASAGWDMACRLVGECRFGRPIDREIGDMIGAATSTGAKQFAYVRYDPDVSQAGLDTLGLPHVKSADVQTLDSIDFIPQIQAVGVAYAAAHVKTAEHLRGFLWSTGCPGTHERRSNEKAMFASSVESVLAPNGRLTNPGRPARESAYIPDANIAIGIGRPGYLTDPPTPPGMRVRTGRLESLRTERFKLPRRTT